MKLNRRSLLKAGALSMAAAPLTKINAFAAAELIQPKILRSVNGVLNVALEAKPTMLPFNGGKRWALTYNGTFPGPTLIAKPGDTINVTLKNSTNMMTNLHTHGPHLPPTGNSDNPFIMIAPGDSFKYSFKITFSSSFIFIFSFKFIVVTYRTKIRKTLSLSKYLWT